MNWIYDNQLSIRLICFLGTLLIILFWESMAPRRSFRIKRKSRWPFNLSISAINVLCLKLVFVITATDLAQIAQSHGWGLLNWLSVTQWTAIILSAVLLDLAIYWQHRIFHLVPFFWRFHKVHHVDQAFDVTTGTRFHPLESIFSMALKLMVILLIGAHPIGVLIFEVLLNCCAMFNHGNITLPKKMDKLIRTFIVTPDMHRVHHSTIVRETNSNYGFSISLWDFIFKSYTKAPSLGQNEMIFGVEEYQDQKYLKIKELLLLPFR
jgi:sterol desaturase/sphingolipid hydroxylase (fatty acid hydroxylase superfamily)